MEKGTPFILEVTPRIPRKLARLEQLANDLWYSWDRSTRTLFALLHPGLWEHVGRSPKAFLRRVDERRLQEAAEDPVFLANYHRVLSAFDTYHGEPLHREQATQGLREDDLIAYFCAEFGFHESFQIYSGGLGILAGDHCKSASDLRLPFVAVGLLYRQGYFLQTIDSEGNQHATYHDSDFDDLPVTPVYREDNSELRVSVPLSGRQVVCKVWRAQVGHVSLFLLDTDLAENSPHDRDIAHQLYGGDRTTRIEQEMVLGVGGVRALREMGLAPTIWHINEGHAAFMVLQRIRDLVQDGLDFAGAMEAVAVSTVFTTHTPVPAGHDHFTEHMALEYLSPLLRELGIDRDQLMALGRMPGSPDFNMTALALHGSRFHNGVSRIHGGVSSHICRDMWPEVEPEENPMAYVTNGVHVPTFLAQDWTDVFDKFLGHEWRNRLRDEEYWSKIDEVPDHLFWSVRQQLKAQMLFTVRARIEERHLRNHGSEAHLDRLFRFANPADPNVLTIGFGRRFATYKRATLLFHNREWLRRIICNDERPVLFIFAGKAHPADQPGQDLIRRINQISREPEFEGRLLLVENYDMALGRRLVSGVDVWLNNPTYPLEASGTSGMKAGINGVLNLSVLDGWWDEGYDGRNGWAIKASPPAMEEHRRNEEESRTLYEILQDQVVPLYYGRGSMGYPPGWVKMAKHSMASLLPRYNSNRMVAEYVQRFYRPAGSQGRRYAEKGYAAAREIAAWKAKVRAAWPRVRLRRLDRPCKNIQFGESIIAEVAVFLDGLRPDDVVVELLMGRESKKEKLAEFRKMRFEPRGALDGGEHIYALELHPDLCGKLEYRVRAYPWHPLLTDRLELGLMNWL